MSHIKRGDETIEENRVADLTVYEKPRFKKKTVCWYWFASWRVAGKKSPKETYLGPSRQGAMLSQSEAMEKAHKLKALDLGVTKNSVVLKSQKEERGGFAYNASRVNESLPGFKRRLIGYLTVQPGTAKSCSNGVCTPQKPAIYRYHYVLPGDLKLRVVKETGFLFDDGSDLEKSMAIASMSFFYSSKMTNPKAIDEYMESQNPPLERLLTVICSEFATPDEIKESIIKRIGFDVHDAFLVFLQNKERSLLPSEIEHIKSFLEMDHLRLGYFYLFRTFSYWVEPDGKEGFERPLVHIPRRF